MTHTECTPLNDLKRTQIPAIEKAIERNRYYLGENSQHYVGGDEAATDFFTHHLLPYWGEIFKALFCTFKCPGSNGCQPKEKYYGIAKMFQKEVDELGIDKILEGGTETERIFSRYKRIINSAEV